MKKAVETSGTIQTQCQLVLDEPLPIASPTRVRVIVLFSNEEDINEKEWFRAAVNNPAFDFLKEQEEDIYSLKDGSPFYDRE